MERSFHMLLYRTFHAQRSFLRPSVTELGLGTGQPKLLTYLALHGPCAQKELAAYFEIDPAAVCRMLDTLERGGFVQRLPGPDRRGGKVQLTEKGRQVQAAWIRRCRGMERAMLRGFSPEERGQFADYLSRAYHNLREADPMGGGAQ